MFPTRKQFLQDVLELSEQNVDSNWEPWCHFPEDPAFWRQQGAEWLEIIAFNYDAFGKTHDLLADRQSRDMLYQLLLFQVVGYRHLKLPVNTPHYWDMRAKAEASVVEKAVRRSWNFDLHRLRWGDLEFIGHPGGIHCLMGLGQYILQRDVAIRPEAGDIVLDLGGCWGDSGLVFADRVGDNGKVYVFEFVDGNVAIAEENFAINARLQPRIELVRHPVSNRTGDNLYFTDNGPATVVRTSPAGTNASARTVTVDDFVALKELPRVDYIKMDIEGVEGPALEGAAETIRRFRPKLAISAYHRFDDLVMLPQLIRSLQPDYKLYLDQYTLYGQEIVLYAI